MKKIILLIVLVGFAYSSSFAIYSRTMKNCGRFGCSSVKELRDEKNVTITCKNPGVSECPTVFGGGQQGGPDEVIANELLQFAITTIQNGTLSGESSNGNFIVVWQSDNIQMTNSSIIITKI